MAGRVVVSSYDGNDFAFVCPSSAGREAQATASSTHSVHCLRSTQRPDLFVTHNHTPQSHLIEVRQRRALAPSVEVRHIDELEVERKAGVCCHEGGRLADQRQVAQVAVPPVVQLGQGGAGTALRG